MLFCLTGMALSSPGEKFDDPEKFTLLTGLCVIFLGKTISDHQSKFIELCLRFEI